MTTPVHSDYLAPLTGAGQRALMALASLVQATPRTGAGALLACWTPTIPAELVMAAHEAVDGTTSVPANGTYDVFTVPANELWQIRSIYGFQSGGNFALSVLSLSHDAGATSAILDRPAGGAAVLTANALSLGGVWLGAAGTIRVDIVNYVSTGNILFSCWIDRYRLGPLPDLGTT